MENHNLNEGSIQGSIKMEENMNYFGSLEEIQNLLNQYIHSLHPIKNYLARSNGRSEKENQVNEAIIKTLRVSEQLETLIYRLRSNKNYNPKLHLLQIPVEVLTKPQRPTNISNMLDMKDKTVVKEHFINLDQSSIRMISINKDKTQTERQIEDFKQIGQVLSQLQTSQINNENQKSQREDKVYHNESIKKDGETQTEVAEKMQLMKYSNQEDFQIVFRKKTEITEIASFGEKVFQSNSHEQSQIQLLKLSILTFQNQQKRVIENNENLVIINDNLQNELNFLKGRTDHYEKILSQKQKSQSNLNLENQKLFERLQEKGETIRNHLEHFNHLEGQIDNLKYHLQETQQENEKLRDEIEEVKIKKDEEKDRMETECEKLLQASQSSHIIQILSDQMETVKKSYEKKLKEIEQKNKQLEEIENYTPLYSNNLIEEVNFLKQQNLQLNETISNHNLQVFQIRRKHRLKIQQKINLLQQMMKEKLQLQCRLNQFKAQLSQSQKCRQQKPKSSQFLFQLKILQEKFGELKQEFFLKEEQLNYLIEGMKRKNQELARQEKKNRQLSKKVRKLGQKIQSIGQVLQNLNSQYQSSESKSSQNSKNQIKQSSQSLIVEQPDKQVFQERQIVQEYQDYYNKEQEKEEQKKSTSMFSDLQLNASNISGYMQNKGHQSSQSERSEEQIIEAVNEEINNLNYSSFYSHKSYHHRSLNVSEQQINQNQNESHHESFHQKQVHSGELEVIQESYQNQETDKENTIKQASSLQKSPIQSKQVSIDEKDIPIKDELLIQVGQEKMQTLSNILRENVSEQSKSEYNSVKSKIEEKYKDFSVYIQQEKYQMTIYKNFKDLEEPQAPDSKINQKDQEVQGVKTFESKEIQIQSAQPQAQIKSENVSQNENKNGSISIRDSLDQQISVKDSLEEQNNEKVEEELSISLDFPGKSSKKVQTKISIQAKQETEKLKDFE